MRAGELGRFHKLFVSWARHVRLRLAARRLLTGFAIGLTLASIATALLWWQRLGAFRPWTLVIGLFGVLIAMVISLRKRWSDADVALYLHARLGSIAAISTTVQ